MFYLIVTARSLLWMLISLVATLTMLGALVSPFWLELAEKQADFGNETITYTPSVGVYTKCARPARLEQPVCTTIAVRGLATDTSVFPAFWKSATIFIAFGLTIMTVTVCGSVMSCCFQSVFKKSIFTTSGAAQAFAGICFIIGIMQHPMAWGTNRVRKLCGRDASPFYPGDCSLGSGLYLSVLSTILTFISACLSVPADKSTSSDKVQDKIYEGHTLICLK